MRRPAKPTTTAALRDGPAVPAELVFVAMVLMLGALLALAGVPLEAEPVAGDGSEALRRGWMEQRQAEALADAAAPLEAADR